MELIYKHEQLLMVTHVKNLLHAAQITSHIQHEFLSAGAGDLAPLDTWPELWVETSEVERAQHIITSMSEYSQSVWVCQYCQQDNPGSFELCWYCQHDKLAPAPQAE